VVPSGNLIRLVYKRSWKDLTWDAAYQVFQKSCILSSGGPTKALMK
jgi:hypothetical protein